MLIIGTWVHGGFSRAAARGGKRKQKSVVHPHAMSFSFPRCLIRAWRATTSYITPTTPRRMCGRNGCQGQQGGTVVQWEYCGGTVGTRVRLTCGEGDISRVWFSIPFAARERLRPEISQAGGITTSCWGRRNIKIYIWVPIYGTLPSETIFICCVFLISPLEAGPRRQGSITGCFPWR